MIRFFLISIFSILSCAIWIMGRWLNVPTPCSVDFQSPHTSRSNKKLRQFLLKKLPQQSFSVMITICSRTKSINTNVNPILTFLRQTKLPFLCKYTCGTASEQVFWLISYQASYSLPSQFPNDRLSPTRIKWLGHIQRLLIAGDSHPIPFSTTMPWWNTSFAA